MATKIRDTFDNTSLKPFKSVDPFNEDNSSEQNTISARPSDLKPMKSDGMLDLSFKQQNFIDNKSNKQSVLNMHENSFKRSANNSVLDVTNS